MCHEDLKLSPTVITATVLGSILVLADDHVIVCYIPTSICSKRFAETGSEGRRGGWVANSSRQRGVRERGRDHTTQL